MKIAHWNRIETKRRNRDLTSSLKASTQDPLWYMCRQWQMGEFVGEDAGSPVQADLEHSYSRLSRYAGRKLGENQQANGTGYNPLTRPLETHVERPVGSDWLDIRFAVEAGQQFLRFIATVFASDPDAAEDYRQLYVDPAGPDLGIKEPSQDAPRNKKDARLLRASVDHAVDGRLLYDRVKTAFGSGPLPSDLVRGNDDSDGDVSTAAYKWMEWYESHFSSADATANDAWRHDRLEHHVSVSAESNGATETVLESTYDGEGFDWYSFDERPDAALDAAGDGNFTADQKQGMLPTPILYPGMPNPRWWEFEDRQVSFPDVDAANLDLARLFVLDFALIYANDWFTLPVTLPIGAVSRIEELRVFDTINFEVPTGWSEIFGGHVVDAADSNQSGWTMYRHATPKHADLTASEDFLFLAPSLARSLESEPVENVLLIRDEMANLAWGIESDVVGAAGFTHDREEQWRSTLQPPAPPSSDDGEVFAYSLASGVPDYWYPLVPKRRDNNVENPVVNLKRGLMLQEDGQPQELPQGMFLDGMGEGGNLPATPIPEEEVPRSGVQLSQTYQFARWSAGRVVVWKGRRRNVGRGEGASQLTYDDLKAGADQHTT